MKFSLKQKKFIIKNILEMRRKIKLTEQRKMSISDIVKVIYDLPEKKSWWKFWE